MRTSNLRATVAIGGAFLFISLLSFGCGNPEAPQIKDVRLSYWDSIIPVPEDPDWDPDWVTLENGGVAPQSRVRIKGNITDNTAVVNPRIQWIGDRGDVDESGFTECSEGTNDFYECEMECEGPTPDGYFECTPALDAPKLIRGDQFLMTGTTAGGERIQIGSLRVRGARSDGQRRGCRGKHRVQDLTGLQSQRGPRPHLVRLPEDNRLPHRDTVGRMWSR